MLIEVNKMMWPQHKVLQTNTAWYTIQLSNHKIKNKQEIENRLIKDPSVA